MNDRDEARILAALLAQGRSIHLFACSISMAAAFLFLLSIAFHGPWFQAVPILAVLLLGATETWAAFRVGFDAQLFNDIAHGQRDASEEIAAMDATLVQLDLMPKEKAGRPMADRRKGAMRLLKLQAGMVAAQIAILVILVPFTLR